MRADIKPNRISISDRYPMLGFTIRALSTDQLAEVTLATDLTLFRDKSQRSADNFFSTASMGPLQIKDGEAVYIVPAEIMARFVGKKKIYFALATKSADGSGDWQIQEMPDEASIFISVEGLTGRGLRRVRAFPDRNRIQAPGYGANGQVAVSWAGDTVATPGIVAQSPSSRVNADPNVAAPETNFAPSVPSQPQAPYNDGFGELPPLPVDAETPATATQRDPISESIAENDDVEDDRDEDETIAEELGVQSLGVRTMEFGERVASQAPDVKPMDFVLRSAFELMLVSNPAFAAAVASARLANAQGLSVGLGLAASAGFAAGGTLGAGIILGKDGDLGIYGFGELDLGALFGASVTVQMTVLRGGIDAFSGITVVAGFTAGEGIVGGGVAIFDTDSNFIGVSVEVGLGVGSPLETFAGVQRGVSHSFGYATAFSAGPTLAEPMMRDSDADARRYVPRWRSLLNWREPSSIRAAVSRRGYSVQTFASAEGDLNIDKLEVRIDRLPSGQSANDLIRHIRLNLPRFVNPSLTDFQFMSGADRTKWSSSSPIGTVFKLEIPGDNAAVVASMVVARKWRFTTIETAATGTHPVSGHREFGIREVDGGFIVYTKGADRFTYPSVLGALETPAFAIAERLWRSFQEKVADHVNRNGGRARVLTPFRRHFSWDEAQRVLRGGGTSTSHGQSHTLGAGSDPYTVEVKYRMFIPSPAINGPPLMNDFGGDNRGFSYSSGSSRGEVVAKVKFTNGMGVDNIRVTKREWGESKGYDSDDTHAVSGKPDWWLGLRDGARPEERETLRATPDNLNIVPGTTGRRAIEAYAENASVVSVNAEGRLPLVPMSPDIDSDVALFFRKRGGQIQVKAVGSHDGFPCHELYVNGKTIHRYDPVRADNTPNALLGTSDISVRSDWVDVASVSGSAQSLSINESFTSNWDAVQKVPQPTDMSCWAAAAAMVVGWRDKISLSPTTISEIVNRPIEQGLSIDNFEDLATGLGLTPVAGQSFTTQGFRDLLENNGPLWVGVALPGSIHAIVVTGLFSDEDGDLMVRITDPWDRIVGTPGSPGPHKSTHQTGSRYIMTWEAFEAEYSQMGASTTATYQILHSGGIDGHTLNRGSETPSGYAAGLGINESFSINWDAVQKVPQPTDMSCWAAAAAMVVGWRNHQSLTPQSMAEIAGRPIAQGLDPDDIGDLARALDLTTEAPQSYTPAAFRALVEDKGPLWVGIAPPGSLHAVVVTGMYNDEDGDLMVRITDPWDRVVGTPGSPGSHKSTHRTGSRYIMTWVGFEEQYARMGASTSIKAFQILHANGHHRHVPNTGGTTPQGYAAGLSGDAAPVAAAQPATDVSVTVSAQDASITPAHVITMSGPNGVPTEQRWQAAVTEILGETHLQNLSGIPALASERQWSVAVGHDTAEGYGAAGVGISSSGAIFRYGGDSAAMSKPAMATGSDRMLVTVAEGAPELFNQWTRARAFSATNGVTGAVLMNGSELPLALAMRVIPGPTMQYDIQLVAAAITKTFTPATPAQAPETARAPAANSAPYAPAVSAAPDAPTTPDMSPAAVSALASVLNQVSSTPPPVAMPATGNGPGITPQPPLPTPPNQPVDGDFPPPGVEVHRSDVTRNGVQYGLFLMDGTVFPEMPPAVQSPLRPGAQVVLDDWPYLDGPSGRSKGGVVIDWSYGGGAVANVRTAPVAPAALDGWAIQVQTDVGPYPSEDTESKLKVTVRTTFTKDGEATRNGLCCVILCGSGKHDVEHTDESPAAPQMSPQAAFV